MSSRKAKKQINAGIGCLTILGLFIILLIGGCARLLSGSNEEETTFYTPTPTTSSAPSTYTPKPLVTTPIAEPTSVAPVAPSSPTQVAPVEDAPAQENVVEQAPADQPAYLVPPAPAETFPAEQAPAPAAGTYYKNCSEAKAQGAAPLYAGQDGYGKHLDRDGDGIACEK